MLYRVTVLDNHGEVVPGILVRHAAPCRTGCDPESSDSAVTDEGGVALLTVHEEPFGHWVQAVATDEYTGDRKRGSWPGLNPVLTTGVVPVTLKVKRRAAQAPMPGTQTQPVTPGTTPAPGSEAPGDQGTAPAPHPIVAAHTCGAPCTSKEGPCERHTTNTGGCYQHRGFGGHAAAA